MICIYFPYLLQPVKGHLNGDMKGQNGSRIQDVKLLDLKDLVFGARDIENDLMFKRQGYINSIIRRHR